MTAARLSYPDRMRAYAAAGMPAAVTLSSAELRAVAHALDAADGAERMLAQYRAAEAELCAARAWARRREAIVDRTWAWALYFAALASAGNVAATLGELFRWAP